MTRRALDLGECGDIAATPQHQIDGKWRTAPNARAAIRWRARCYLRGQDGVRAEIARVAKTKRRAVELVEMAVAEHGRGSAIGGARLTPSTPFLVAGGQWLESIARPDAGLSARTVTEYRSAYTRYVDCGGSILRGLTIDQTNDAQRLGAFLRTMADAHGTGSAKLARSVVGGILGLCVRAGVLRTNALRSVGPVKAKTARVSPRDLRRSFTRAERDALIEHAYSLAEDAERLSRSPRTVRKAYATADLIALMAGLGVRINEARSLRWEHVDLDTGTVHVPGTKTLSSERRLDAPAWLLDRLRTRAERVGPEGYVLASPTSRPDSDGSTRGVKPYDPEALWDQSNSATAIRAVLDSAGFEWAVPHSLRRTTATLLHEQGVPLVRIADQLGHKGVEMVQARYLGRDFGGSKQDLAALL